VVSVAPSPELRRHHDIEAPLIDATAFRQGWRITSRLDALHRDGALGPVEWQAAVEFRQAWERVKAANSGGGGLPMRVSGGAASGGVADRLATVTDTVTRLREVEEAIGGLAHWLCFACVVEDYSWAAIGRHLHRDPHTARTWTVAAIGHLTAVWWRPRRRRSPARWRTRLHGLEGL
jgi:hypothetical protein